MKGKDFFGNISYENNVNSHSFVSSDSSVGKGFKLLAYGLIADSNSLVIAAFKLNPNGKLRTVNNMFIVSMAAGDLLLPLGSIPERKT